MDRFDEAPLAKLQQQNRLLDRLAVLGPQLSVAITAAICIAWLSRAAVLFDALPFLFEAKFNAALGLLLVGLAFLLQQRGARTAAVVLASAAVLLGALMLSGTWLGWPRDIDGLLIRDWTVDPLAQVRQVPSATAITFILLALVVLAVEWVPATLHRNIAIRLVCILIIALGIEVLVDRAVQGEPTPLPPHWSRASETARLR